MLASDLNNSEFAGARNPEDMLQKEFYDYAAEDTWATESTGIKTYKKSCPFIRISIPGRSDLTIERPADERDVKKYPREWLHYQMQTGKIANAENVPGWSIDEWSDVDPEQARQLKYLRFYTVEQIAGANDAQVQGIGMGGMGLRERAKAALKVRNGQQVNQEMKARDDEIAALKAQMAQMMEMMQGSASVPSELEEPKKRGRKAKSEVE